MTTCPPPLDFWPIEILTLCVGVYLVVTGSPIEKAAALAFTLVHARRQIRYREDITRATFGTLVGRASFVVAPLVLYSVFRYGRPAAIIAGIMYYFSKVAFPKKCSKDIDPLIDIPQTILTGALAATQGMSPIWTMAFTYHVTEALLA